jgi:hypothetical protein
MQHERALYRDDGVQPMQPTCVRRDERDVARGGELAPARSDLVTGGRMPEHGQQARDLRRVVLGRGADGVHARSWNRFGARGRKGVATAARARPEASAAAAELVGRAGYRRVFLLRAPAIRQMP